MTSGEALKVTREPAGRHRGYPFGLTSDPAVLVRHVWPQPTGKALDFAAALDLATARTVSYGAWSANLREDGSICARLLGTSSRGWGLVVEEVDLATLFGWPRLEADANWRLASILTAWEHGIHEVVCDPIGFKAMLRDQGTGAEGVRHPDGRIAPPQRFMEGARCDTNAHEAPSRGCFCGFHAARLPSRLALWYPHATGILVVSPVGWTVWHRDGWRSAGYEVHAAVAPRGWQIPDGWDPAIPIIPAERPLILSKAHEVAREICGRGA